MIEMESKIFYGKFLINKPIIISDWPGNKSSLSINFVSNLKLTEWKYCIDRNTCCILQIDILAGVKLDSISSLVENTHISKLFDVL